MILDGERRGLLTRDKILIDATSGNTGIAYAMIAAERGYRVKLALPKNASAGTKAKSDRIWRGTGFDRSDRGNRWRAAACEAGWLKAEPEKIFLSRSVQQRRELAGALRNDRDGNLETDRRARHAFRHRSGNQRNIRWGHAKTEGIESGDPVHQHAAGWAVAWVGRTQAYADRIGAGHLRCVARGRSDRQSRRKMRIRWCCGWRGRKDCWWGFRRVRIFCRPAGRQRIERGRRRDDFLRFGREISVGEFLARIQRSGEIGHELRFDVPSSYSDQREGSAVYPNECCGAMLGRDDRPGNPEGSGQRIVQRLEPLANAFSPMSSITGFRLIRCS